MPTLYEALVSLSYDSHKGETRADGIDKVTRRLFPNTDSTPMTELTEEQARTLAHITGDDDEPKLNFGSINWAEIDSCDDLEIMDTGMKKITLEKNIRKIGRKHQEKYYLKDEIKLWYGIQNYNNEFNCYFEDYFEELPEEDILISFIEELRLLSIKENRPETTEELLAIRCLCQHLQVEKEQKTFNR